MTEPEVAANEIIEAIEGERSRIFIGQDAKLMNLLARISPSLAAHLIYRNMKGLLG